MLPTFFGLNTVTRALLAQQEAVDVVNQNIANASTPGYSRQQAILTATDPYTSVAFDRPSLPGQLGTGATVSKIKRFQDELLNTQIRAQNQTTGQYEAMDDLYTQVQAIYNDPSTLAVNQASTNFFNAVHDLSNNPESVPAREALQQQGQTLSAAIGTDYQQLTTLQGDLNAQVGTIVADVNTTIQQIASLNTQIAQVTGIGDNANDLMDQRDQLVNHLSTLVDTHDVKNPDGTDTIQLNGRFLVNKDQAYTLTTLTDAASSAYVKPVQVFWQEDVTKFQNIHPGYDPITGVNLTTGASLSSTAQPPLSVKQTDVTTGSLYGAMAMRDQVIQDTLIPQLNALADGLTNTQVLSPKGGLDPTASQAGLGGTGSFTVTVLTPQGQTVTYNPSVPSGSAPTTVQGVIDAINGSVVAPYVHASLSAAGQLELDTTQTGTLVKVDQANAIASRLFGFSQSVADGFNAVHVQGFGLDTPPQWTGGISGLTLSTPIGTGDGLTVTGPDGVPVNVVVQPPLTDLKVLPTASITSGFTVSAQPSSPQNLAVAINGATTSGTVTIVGTDRNGNALSEALNFNGNGTLTTQSQFATVTSVTGGGGFNVAATTVSVTALSTPNTVQDLLNAINSVNQTDTQAIGSVKTLTPLTSVTGKADFTITVVRPDGVKVTFDPAAATPAVSTMQDVLDAINGTGSYLSNTVSGYVRAFINPQGQLEIDSTTPGALVKVDQATAATNTALGFQTGTLPDPVGQEHGFQASLDSQGRLIISSQPTVYNGSGQLQNISAQLVGTKGVTGATTLGVGGSMTVVGPNGQLQLTLGTAGSTDNVTDLIATINAANMGVTASINSAGQFQLTTPEIGANATITLT
ncbi:MAG: flagellar hook-associated protein FlgK, partial [Chloroflexota bacterium]